MFNRVKTAIVFAGFALACSSEGGPSTDEPSTPVAEARQSLGAKHFEIDLTGLTRGDVLGGSSVEVTVEFTGFTAPPGSNDDPGQRRIGTCQASPPCQIQFPIGPWVKSQTFTSASPEIIRVDGQVILNVTSGNMPPGFQRCFHFGVNRNTHELVRVPNGSFQTCPPGSRQPREDATNCTGNACTIDVSITDLDNQPWQLAFEVETECQPTGPDTTCDGIDDDCNGVPDDMACGAGPDFKAAPGGARRILARHYRRAIAEMLGPDAAAAALPPNDPSTGGEDAIAAREVPIDPASVQRLEVSALAAAQRAVEVPARLAELAPCVTQGPSDQAFRDVCYGEVATRLGFLAFRLPVTVDVRARLVEIAKLGEQGVTTDPERLRSGLKFLIATILEAPSFLYSIEVGSGTAVNRDLDDFELATRLSLFLLGRPPSEALLQRAANDELSSEAGVRAIAAELVEQAVAREGFYDHIEQMFELRLLDTKSKGNAAFGPPLIASMKEEVRRLAEDVVFDNPSSFFSILTSERRQIDDLLALNVYGIVPQSTGWAFVNFATAKPEQERSGVLTTSAVMAVFSHLDQNSPTRRGLFIIERLFCGDIPPPAADVNTALTPSGGTLRQFMEQHASDPNCAGCHAQMDPMGFTFERFGTIGDFRITDNGFPIDASGDVEGVPVSGPRQLMQQLTQPSRGVARCWIKQFYRGGVGIKEIDTPDQQGSALDALGAEFGQTGFDMKTLLVELVASPAFRQVGAPR